VTEQPPGQVAVFRISLTNATLLSVAYLVFATVIELLRRVTGARWAELVSKSIEGFPAGVLRFLGAFYPLQRAWVHQEVTDTQVRLIYGATVVVIIFLLGLFVGAGMWLVSWVQRRRAGH
jgi:hypothetical protein